MSYCSCPVCNTAQEKSQSRESISTLEGAISGCSEDSESISVLILDCCVQGTSWSMCESHIACIYERHSFTSLSPWCCVFQVKIQRVIEEKERVLLETACTILIQQAWRKMKERHAAKLLLIILRIERERNSTATVIERAWRSYFYIRLPINRRADTRARNNLLRLRQDCARLIQVMLGESEGREGKGG